MVRALFPGTFDPIHLGHIDIAERASRLFDEIVMAVYDKPSKSLLFSPEERINLVQEAFKDNPKIKVTGYSGLTVEFARKIKAQAIVRGLRVFSDFEFEFRMALANHRLAPDIEIVALITAEEHTFLSSTTVREIAMLNGDITSMAPPFVIKAFKEKAASLGDQPAVPNSLRD
ncbi:MAG: pantetheine-phosphate adenylyltransferase [Anaerolineales bacterium]|nr:pantetheine-phosphate adenylyltransferase [Anaerolineales bacterium]MCL4260351.1 pantetheine-phosphate adenylyltransferase [Anaerolineales bacterium]HRQ32300.1 pantetheine-phosphate adenylyltransferase [Anaerolineales bacterium]